MYWIYFSCVILGGLLIKMTPEIAKDNKDNPNYVQLSPQTVNVLVAIGWLLMIVACILLLIHALE